MRIKYAWGWAIGLALGIPGAAGAMTCPPVETIGRTPGTYEWTTTVSGWVGRFLQPMHGKGRSYGISRFDHAEWIQLQDRPGAPGVLQCHYVGDFSSEIREIIEFTQTHSRVSETPVGVEWTCKPPARFPGTACFCSGSVAACATPETADAFAAGIPD